MQHATPVAHRVLVLAIALLTTTVALAGCMENDNGDGTTDDEASSHKRIMTKAENVSADIDTPEEAWAAGYRPDAFCIPGMGAHWIHKPGENESFFDTTLDPDHPEAVLFLPDDGNMSNITGDEFLGIEFVAVTEGTDMNSTETVPQLFGQPLDGPMPGHAPGMPWHAELHVYLAEGLRSDASFPESQDAIQCPEGTTPPAQGG